MEKNKVIAEVNNTNKQELTEEERLKKEQEIREYNKKTREEARKARHPSVARMAQDIRSMVKMAANPYEPTEAKKARALLGFFLKELTTHPQGKHIQVAKRLQTQMKEKQPLQLWMDDATILANAAIRYDISFGRVTKR